MKSFILNNEMFRVANPKPSKKPKVSSGRETYLWHLRLDHINLDRINRLTKDGPLRKLKVGSLPFCESCLDGKMTKRSFLLKEKEPKNHLSLFIQMFADL